MTTKCVYCNINPASRSEHVFPYGLGGANIYLDCVCNECNKYFSGIERELIQKSIIGLMRSAEGVEGYKKNKTRPAPLKFPNIFHHDEKSNVVYEIGSYKGFKSYIRPQLIEIKDTIYIEGASQEELEKFVEKLNVWMERSKLVIILPQPKEKPRVVRFFKEKGNISFSPTEVGKTKGGVIFSGIGDQHEYYQFFQPRLFMTDDNDLILRARSEREGFEFMVKLLTQIQERNVQFSSYSKEDLKTVSVGFSFDMIKAQQALLKICLNSLFYYYPSVKANIDLELAKKFVLGKSEPSIPITVDEKMPYFDRGKNIHYLMFYQHPKGLRITLSLFNADFKSTFYFSDFKLLPERDLSFVEINYKLRKQVFLTLAEFVSNRIEDYN